MKYSFLKRPGNRKLIIFFNGWSMDDSLFSCWETGEFDLLAAHDYNPLDALPEVGNYAELHLAAWSLGVWAAARILESGKWNFETATAFNGTLRPVDPEYGIAPEVFAGTADNWGNERGRERFLLRLAGGRTMLEQFRRPQRTPESQQAELYALQAQVTGSPVPDNPFRTAWIGGRDQIIPAAAQRKSWGGSGVHILENPDAPHFPFAAVKSWAEVVEIGRNR